MKQSSKKYTAKFMGLTNTGRAHVVDKKRKPIKDFERLSDVTAIYVRLSKEDEKKNAVDESYSIQNQITLSLDHAKCLSLPNIVIFIDDGLSGVFFDDSRPSFVQMMTLLQEGKIRTVVIKDLSRLGRNYREAGECTETIFPYYNVRFISIGDGIDKQNIQEGVRLNTGFDINIAFKNLMNEGYVQDLSNKLRLAQAAKSKRGYAIGKPPYGYKRDDEDHRRWAVDEEAAEIVRYIYRMRLDGMSVVKIADRLRAEKILIPVLYAARKGYHRSQTQPIRGDFFWSHNTVRKILMNQSYVGDVINFKTYTLSYKDKTKYDNEKENMDIHTDIHEPVIEREQWEIVQQSFRRNVRGPKNVKKHPLAGYLFCSDCGTKLHYKLAYPNPANHYFSCGANRRSKDLCTRSHHIRVDEIEPFVLHMIDQIVRFAKDFEDEFVKIVVDERYKLIKLGQEKNKRELAKLKARNIELENILSNLYEDKIKGVLSEELFSRLLKKYEAEGRETQEQIAALQEVVEEDAQHEVNVNGFLKLVRKYTRINELTPEIIQSFIGKIVVSHKQETVHGMTQEIDVYFNMVGKVTLPTIDEKKQYLKSFARKKEQQTA